MRRNGHVWVMCRLRQGGRIFPGRESHDHPDVGMERVRQNGHVWVISPLHQRGGISPGGRSHNHPDVETLILLPDVETPPHPDTDTLAPLPNVETPPHPDAGMERMRRNGRVWVMCHLHQGGGISPSGENRNHPEAETLILLPDVEIPLLLNVETPPHPDADTLTLLPNGEALPHPDGEALPHPNGEALPHPNEEALPHPNREVLPHPDEEAPLHPDEEAPLHPDGEAPLHPDEEALPHPRDVGFPHPVVQKAEEAWLCGTTGRDRQDLGVGHALAARGVGDGPDLGPGNVGQIDGLPLEIGGERGTETGTEIETGLEREGAHGQDHQQRRVTVIAPVNLMRKYTCICMLCMYMYMLHIHV